MKGQGACRVLVPSLTSFALPSKDFDGWADSSKCKNVDTIAWADVDKDKVVPYGWDWDSVSTCKEQSVTNQMGAISTTATLVFAMNGCLTRIRRVADTNFQSTCTPPPAPRRGV